jgi:hypothetical protein
MQKLIEWYRDQRVLGLANDTSVVCEQGLRRRDGYHDVDASRRVSGEVAGREGRAGTSREFG